MQHYDYEAVLAAIAMRVKEVRKLRGLTQMAMATEYGYHLSHWRNIENGRKMSLPTLVRIANTFEMELSSFVVGIDKQDGPGFGSKGYQGPPEDND